MIMRVRPATQDEFEVAVDWAAVEGWNPGLDDLDAFFAADPNGFLMGFEDGEPVSSISVVRYGDNFGFLGFYIVKPEWRGRGAGMATWQAGMAYLNGRTVGLDGVLAQQSNYTKSGFVMAGRNVRYQGLRRADISQSTSATKSPATALPSTASDVRPVAPSDFSALVQYDRAFFADDRTPFLERWCLPPIETQRWSYVASAGQDVIGYITIRACRTGYKIGPLFANDVDLARHLFQVAVQTCDVGASLILDVPEANIAATTLATDLGLSPVFETARMYRGAAPNLLMNKTFGLTSFELG